jgi:hypothetical protein
LLFAYSIPSRRINTAIIGLGGGASVLIADTWARAGINVPIFPPEVQQKLKSIYVSDAGRSFRNPIDVIPFGQRHILPQTLEAITSSDQIDCVLLHLALAYTSGPLREFIRCGMPVLAELPPDVRRRLLVLVHEVVTEDDRHLAGKVEEACHRADVPVFHSASATALALTRYQQYYQKRS